MLTMTSVALGHRYTFRDYLDLEETSDVRFEYLDGEIYAMAGGTAAHARVCARLLAQLVPLTDGRGCDAYTSDLRVRVLATGLATYPDAAVVCGPIEYDPESPTHCTNPSILFEVLSPATEDYDRGKKREHYQRIESLREYFVLARDRPYAERWSRNAAGGWDHHVIDAEGHIVLDSIGGSFPLAELYRSAAS